MMMGPIIFGLVEFFSSIGLKLTNNEFDGDLFCCLYGHSHNSPIVFPLLVALPRLYSVTNFNPLYNHLNAFSNQHSSLNNIINRVENL
jgi:hypothetical protein